MAHPLSQAEADRVFSPSERKEAVERRFTPSIKNMKQRAYREGRKAREALEAWFSPLGTAEDVLDYEKAAEAQQILAGKVAGMEAEAAEISKP